jgi:hypothetical protein
VNDINNADQVPLTFIQKARLIVECIPVIFFTAVFIFSVTVLDDITGAPAPPALLLFLGFVIIVVGWIAINRLRDLVSGVVLIHEDVLERSWRSRGASGPRSFRGKFEQLGTMRLSSKAYGQGQNGFRYRVSLSPASKIVWSLEKVQ